MTKINATKDEFARLYNGLVEVKDLKSKKFGKNNNLWYFWVKLHTLQRWTAIDKEIDEYMETYWEEGKNMFDKSVVNAIANQNLEGVKYEDIK